MYGARRPGREAPQYGHVVAPDRTFREQRRHSVKAPPSPCTKRNWERRVPHWGHFDATLETVWPQPGHLMSVIVVAARI
jgi:hypothetical protein